MPACNYTVITKSEYKPLTLALSHIPLYTAHRAFDTNFSSHWTKFFFWRVVVEHFQQCTEEEINDCINLCCDSACSA